MVTQNYDLSNMPSISIDSKKEDRGGDQDRMALRNKQIEKLKQTYKSRTKVNIPGVNKSHGQFNKVNTSKQGFSGELDSSGASTHMLESGNEMNSVS